MSSSYIKWITAPPPSRPDFTSLVCFVSSYICIDNRRQSIWGVFVILKMNKCSGHFSVGRWAARRSTAAAPGSVFLPDPQPVESQYFGPNPQKDALKS